MFVFIPGVIKERPIAWKWCHNMRDLSLAEKADLVIQLLNDATNAVCLGLLKKFDKVDIICDDSSALKDILLERSELKGLTIKHTKNAVIITHPQEQVTITSNTGDETFVVISSGFVEPEVFTINF